MISRHLLLVVVSVLTATHTAHAQSGTTEAPYVPQPCPFDCLTCDSVTQTCESCPDGFRLDDGRCHLAQCDTAKAHKARMADDGSRDDRMAEWSISAVDSYTHTVTVSVYVPPRFHCELTGHALSDAMHWEEWLSNASTTPCPSYVPQDGYCGPTNKRWTPVLMLGREADEPIGSDIKGYLRLPIGVDNAQTTCLSAYRNVDNHTIVDQTGTTNNLVTSYNPDSGMASMDLPLVEMSTPDDPLHCPELRTIDLISGVDQQGPAGKRFQYWQKDVVGAVTNWRFDATLCYVDETGEQSVCPFSSPVWEMSVNGITNGVSVTPAGTAELIYVPKCELFLRSAQIRYTGEIESRNATGEFEITVVCQGADYMPDITGITHCQCEEDDNGHCIILEEDSSCADDNSTCQVSAMFKSWNFSASQSDFLQLSCERDDSLEDGRFVVEVAHDYENCDRTDSCVDISPTQLFGAAPLQATDDLDTMDGLHSNDTNTLSIFAGLMKSNDLRVPPGEEDYFHQFNRTYLNFTTVRRVVGPEQKNSFVMCAMMQPDRFPRYESIQPANISYKFRVSIQEVTFDVTWRDGRPNTQSTLTELMDGNTRWPSQWIWEHQEELALRREVVGRRTGRANAPCGEAVCQVTPMQDHVYTHTDEWDHIQENFDCVGISPFYLYSLLTLNQPEAIVDSAAVTLRVFHEYQGRYIVDDAGNRRLLQAGSDDPVFARTQTQQYGGAFQWISKTEAQMEQQKDLVVNNKVAASKPSSSSIPMVPIVIGTMVASMACLFFAVFAFWRRRRKQPQDKKLGPKVQFSTQSPQVVVQLNDIELRQAGQV